MATADKFTFFELRLVPQKAVVSSSKEATASSFFASKILNGGHQVAEPFSL